jgi:stress response protein YsnF
MEAKAKSHKIIKTVRFNEEELERIKLTAQKHSISQAEVIREAVTIGLIDLLEGEEEDELLRARMADKSKDIDGATFIKALKKEFGI